MCGLAGAFDRAGTADLAAVRAMIARLRHRGPDAEGTVSRGAVALGHARLSIIDVSAAANQPMSDGDETCWLVFNGEIYNHHALRAELTAAGAVFRTRSDTEVILEGYKRWGADCVARFNGMFAFALWDERAQTLILARDRLGKKPLYYAETPTGLIFASELPALRRHPEAPKAINPAGIRQMLTLGYLLGSDCILGGVQKLEPGTLLVARRDRPPEARRYWSPAPAFAEKSRWRSPDEAADALDALMRDAVKLRLESDVPLGAFLSGGIDSSLIVAMMRGTADGRVDTFTAGFGDASYDERPQARAIAAHLGVALHEQEVADDAMADLPRLMALTGEPFADTSLLPTYHLCGLARRRVTVSLSGDGGDELFAGYETYVADRLHHFVHWLPGPLLGLAERTIGAVMPASMAKVSFDYKLRQFLAGARHGFRRAHYSWRNLFGEDELGRLIRPEQRAARQHDPYDGFERHYDDVADCHYLDQAAYVDLKTWLPDDILVKLDRASMAHGLEARAPFLDYRLVEFAAALPVELKLRLFQKKFLLRRLHGRYFPAELRAKRKLGFNAPVAHWFARDREESLRAFTHDAALLEWVEAGEIDRLWREHKAGARDNGFRLFALACLGAWFAADRAETGRPA